MNSKKNNKKTKNKKQIGTARLPRNVDDTNDLNKKNRLESSTKRKMTMSAAERILKNRINRKKTKKAKLSNVNYNLKQEDDNGSNKNVSDNSNLSPVLEAELRKMSRATENLKRAAKSKQGVELGNANQSMLPGRKSWRFKHSDNKVREMVTELKERMKDSANESKVPALIQNLHNDNLLDFYQLLGDIRLQLFDFKKNFVESIKYLSKDNDNSNDKNSEFSNNEEFFSELAHSLDFLHPNILELHELYSNLNDEELLSIEPETKEIFHKLIKDILELVKIDIIKQKLIQKFEKFVIELDEFISRWNISKQIPINASPSNNSFIGREEVIKKIPEFKNNILFLFKKAALIVNMLTALYSITESVGSNLLNNNNSKISEKYLLNKKNLFSVFLDFRNSNNDSKIFPIESKEDRKYYVAKLIIKYVLNSYIISKEIESHPNYQLSNQPKSAYEQLFAERYHIKDIDENYRVLLLTTYGIYIDLLENNAYNFNKDYDYHSSKFEDFYNFLSDLFRLIQKKKEGNHVLLKFRPLIITKMFLICKKILTKVIYTDEELNKFRVNNYFVRKFLLVENENSSETTLDPYNYEILSSLKLMYSALIIRNASKKRLVIENESSSEGDEGVE